ncbi:hypothetical protein F4809DRAFT_640688 [Biscogniauxia mediterranea]|nr:hypothetical protein F4809DRAFT_640688 [Biscogniauxia mediterranea]
MPEKRVTFQSSSSPRGSSRPSYQSSRTSTRDSGFGSLSSDQAGVGGMPDRNFTAQDYIFQSNSIPALREALAEANKQLEVWKSRYAKKEKELSEANKTNKSFKIELDNHYHHIQELEAKNADLEEELESWTEQYNYLSHALTEFEEENRSLRQTIQSMSPTSSQPLPRTRSRQGRESRELTDRMKQRLNGNRNSHRSASSRPNARRPSVSVVIPAGVSGGREPYREPYIEEVPHTLRRSRRESVSHNRPSGDYRSHSLADRTRRQV